MNMNTEDKRRVNKLARLFYKSFGYDVGVEEDEYDFSEALHPQEIQVWNMALIAHDVLVGTEYYGENYVDFSGRLRERLDSRAGRKQKNKK